MTNFITKDSGERQTFSTGMQRDSAQKDLRPDLVYGPMFLRWAELMGRGAQKYGERNWEKARTEEELARFRASAFRHFVQWFYGLNPEEDHAAAVFFNIAGAEYVKDRMAAGVAEPAPGVSEAKPAKWNPKIGDSVKIVGGPRLGDVGRIVEYENADGDDELPWRVRFDDTDRLWYGANELEPAEVVDPPPHASGAV